MAYTSDTDAFEIKRVMRQEAHEKAFEIKVQTQRLFEKEKNKIVKEGRHRIDKDIDAKEQKTVQDLNIQRSTLVIKQRMDLMTKREELMKGLVKEVLQRIEADIAQPSNERYQKVIKDLIMQGSIKLLEPKILLKVRECDKDLIEGMLSELKTEFEALMLRETTREFTVEYEVITDEYIDPASVAGKCGGIILMNDDRKIVCQNTIDNRLHLCYEESLPTIRHQLFPQ